MCVANSTVARHRAAVSQQRAALRHDLEVANEVCGQRPRSSAGRVTPGTVAGAAAGGAASLKCLARCTGVGKRGRPSSAAGEGRLPCDDTADCARLCGCGAARRHERVRPGAGCCPRPRPVARDHLRRHPRLACGRGKGSADVAQSGRTTWAGPCELGDRAARLVRPASMVGESGAPESEAPSTWSAGAVGSFVSSALRLRYVRATLDPRAPSRRYQRRDRVVGHVGTSSTAQPRRSATAGKHSALRRSASVTELR